MIPGRPRCSGEAEGRQEPLFATASLVQTWLLIEQPGAWGPDAVFDSGFPAKTAGPFLQAAARVGIRVLLIRRRSSESRGSIAFLAHSGDDDRPPAMIRIPFADPADLFDLDLERAAQGRLPDPGHRVEEPVFLVCTHGRHDICCADNGRPLYRAISELRPDQTWETSHVGGDRFAGNLVVLPRGDYFGRLAPDDAPGVITEYEAGRLDLAHHRGRSTRPRLVQAAEHYLREAESLAGFDDLVLLEYRRLGPRHAEASFRARGADHRVRVLARPLPDPVFLTCRAEEPGRPVAYDLVSIEKA